MKYLEASFNSRPANKAYRDNWDRMFGKKKKKGQSFLELAKRAGPLPTSATASGDPPPESEDK